MPDISPNPDAQNAPAPGVRFEGPVVKADQLSVRYGKNLALNDVTAVFPPGAVGLLGTNILDDPLDHRRQGRRDRADLDRGIQPSSAGRGRAGA